MNRQVDLNGYVSYSWGLAGVSREHYDDVAIECTARTVINPADRGSFDMVYSTQTVFTSNATELQSGQEQELAARRAERRSRQEIMDQCLTEFGFVKFGLTEEQVGVLATLPRGNPLRRDYMHSLGSDAAVIERQRI